MAGDERDAQPDLSAFGSSAESDSDAATGDDSDAAESAPVEADTDGGGIDTAGGSDAADRPSLADLNRQARVALGVDLLAHLERESLPLPEAVDRIETITTTPALTREILDTAELRGVIDREAGRIRTRRGNTFVRFEEQVVRREGDYECRRCGAGLGTGHFVRFDAGELGPFGPECVRKVLGRA
ncbi:hypothetical protein GCM10008995_27500 [Halobellus salinus]|uniref:Uncharacterized protein n=1 Tax=Halobellus salinus TaxID=931585 RepID=A0A830EEB8_9EURY|nr:hypothetical protein GCM10008995_27500 [Halobellus salinus]SMP31398.1 hypothetical protein SAMN06265347_11826 [Halobellus salinus]